MRTSNYNFDIDKHSLIKPVVIIRSGDHDIDTIKITLSNQGDPVDLTKATVTFMGTTPAGNKIIDDAHVKIVDATTGIFEYTFPSAAGASVGEYQDAYFSIILGNGQTSTMNFRIQVLSGVDISAPAASEYITHYDTMVTALNSAYDSATHETNDKMASTVSSLATSAARVLDSALARVNDVNSTANSASSAASNAVSMASSVASTVTSQASYINSVASSAASSVSSVAAGVVDKLNNIKVGGRNLLLNSAFLNGFSNWNNENNSWTIDGSTYQGNPIVKSPTTVGSGGRLVQRITNPPAAGSKIMVSFNAKGNDSNSMITVTLFNTTEARVSLSSSFSRYTVSFTIPNDFSVPQIYFWNSANGNNVFLNSIKVEAGNVPTDWTPAPEDVDTAMGAYVKKTNILPAEARDFNYLATHMKTYQGYWYTGSESIANAPTGGWTWSVIEVIAGNSDTTGIIRTMRFGAGAAYSANVNGGVIQRWSLIADDANVVHKTGNETLAGDKTLTGKLSATNFEAGGDNYTDTASVDVNYLGTTISFVRIGKLVTFTSGVSSFNTNVSSGLTSGVIPNGFKPALQQNVAATNQDGLNKFFSFDPSGSVYSYSAYTSGTQPRISGTYITTAPWPAN